ncbi:hypothetical protein BDF19DRAFT_165753 [Syncephalis fuscata]|nr:hypothetical protein BDF19DRAFT_165753 [Syncephalis fuscata]
MNTGDQDLSWKQNAARLWNIPLHPSGEADIFDFITAAPNDIDSIRARLLGIYFQGFLSIMLGSMFIQNFIISIRLVINRPYFLAGWCCLLPAFLGTFMELAIYIYLFGHGNCRLLAWLVISSFALSSIINNMIILQKAYIVLLKQRWILVVGFILLIPQLGLILLTLETSYITTEAKGGCRVHYQSAVPIYWFGVTIPVNALFSAIFSYVAYNQYKKFGSEAWKRLMRDGVQIMCIVILCNISCALVVLLKIGKPYSDMFFMLDWYITSTILVRHCNAAKTSKIPEKHFNIDYNPHTIQEDSDIEPLSRQI